MAAKEAKVRVRIDTKQAKEGLRGLGKEGAAAAGRIGRDVGGRGGGQAGGGLRRGFMLGAGLGLGVRAARAIEAGSIGAVVGELFAGKAADFDKWIGAADSRGRKAARQEIVGSLAEITGRTKDTSDAAAVYNNILPRHLARSEGAALIEQRLAGGRGSDPEGQGVLDKLLDPILSTIKSGFDDLVKTFGGHGRGN